MSSYLNFYLVPKKKGDVEPEPLLLMSYNRSSNIYSAYYENLNPAFIGTGDKTNYSELTKEGAHFVVEDIKNDLEKAKSGLKNRVEAYKTICLNSEDTIRDYIEDFTSTKEYIKELEDSVLELQFIANLVNDIDLKYTDFEKVLINVD